MQKVTNAISYLESLNPGQMEMLRSPQKRPHVLQKVLIANRGEIAKRFFLSLKEEGILCVAIVTKDDLGQSWYEMADEVVVIGDTMNYMSIDIVIAAAFLVKANAIYPGYGFLSENSLFVETIKSASKHFARELIFMGPDSSIMRRVGDKIDARKLAAEHGIPLFAGSDALEDSKRALVAAQKIGYPVIVKLNSGGGGKGMQPVFEEKNLAKAIESCQRIGKSLYNDTVFFLEKFIEQPVHMEVQIFNGTAIGIRKCAVQRRNQKIIEESGDVFLNDHMRLAILAAAENMARISGYIDGGAAGTVEFLYDPITDSLGFLEMNTRLQVEHPVTDQALGIDLAKWQILFFDGRENEIPYDKVLSLRFLDKPHAIECRIYAEDPENDYLPSPGNILSLDLPTFNGIRCDFGFNTGDNILSSYDPLIGKVIAHGTSREKAIMRMHRALSELYVKGITTNIYQLLTITRCEQFKKDNYTNRLLLDNPELETMSHDITSLRQAAVFVSLAENFQRLEKTAKLGFGLKDLEALMHDETRTSMPIGYTVELYGQLFDIKLLQNELESFHVFVDGAYEGDFSLIARSKEQNDYLVRFGLQAYSIRVDNRTNYSILRLSDEKRLIHYFKLKIEAQGSGEKTDPQGLSRAPFQGSFVKFCDDIFLGASVKKDQPMIILSAMKMETTINAPVEGQINFLIENGDVNKLQLGSTAQGQIIGKNIGEGEVLFLIAEDVTSVKNNENKSKAKSNQKSLNENSNAANTETVAYLFRNNLEEMVHSNLVGFMPLILTILNLYLKGLITEQAIAEKLCDILNKVPIENWPSVLEKIPETLISTNLLHYASIKKIYSPVMGSHLSHFGELNQIFNNWDDDAYETPKALKETLDTLFESYKLTEWRRGSQATRTRAKRAFMHILRSYQSCENSSNILSTLLKLLNYKEKLSGRTIFALRQFIKQEEAQRNDSLALAASDLLTKAGTISYSLHNGVKLSRQYLAEFREFSKNPIGEFENFSEVQLKQRMIASLQKKDATLLSPKLPIWLVDELKQKLGILSISFKIQPLFSPLQQVVIFKIVNKRNSEDQRYVSISFTDQVDILRDSNNQITGSKSMEAANIDAARVFMAYQVIERLKNNWCEVYCNDSSVILDLPTFDNAIFNYTTIKNIVSKVLPFFSDSTIEYTLVHLRVSAKHKKEKSSIHKTLRVAGLGKNVSISLMSENDQRNPYFTSSLNARTQLLYDRHKWPIEVWVAECFDKDSVKEIVIKSIDKVKWLNTKTQKEEIKAVGGKIFIGNIQGSEVCFYMKDSRISGGATGSLEGLKYTAAAYIAFMKNIPLYIFNDGAGANIKEGVISLNRAGEGFMMNALLGTNINVENFLRYINNHEDNTLQSLCKEIDQEFSWQIDLRSYQLNTFIVAVGIGSSTGLDVYGSSQAAIQIMIDSENSYRVLTGSNVIRSVTGEDMTNYEIGGAKVMSKWTGTVDLVAESKMHLLVFIRKIQKIFSVQSDLKQIQRLNSSISIKHNFSEEVLTDLILHHNVDEGFFLPFKEDFYGAGSLIATFARLGGRAVLIMGPRTNFGIRSYASITKAREMLMISRKTKVNQIIVMGEKWYQSISKDDPLILRARQDFLASLQIRQGVRIHIVLHLGGLNQVTMNSSADAIIFVLNDTLTAKQIDYANKVSMLVVDSIKDAFNIAQRLIQYIDPIDSKVKSKNVSSQVEGIAKLPDDVVQAFDVIADIIKPSFDRNSFIELYSTMNDAKAGPSLVTALAKLDGETVAIIADQPNILGGAPDALGTEKFRVFTEFVNRRKLPLVMLSNAPGFIPGTKQERLRIQQIGAYSLDANILGKGPVVSVVLNQNYGGRQIQAFSKSLRPAIVYIAMKKAVIAVMGAKSAFDLFHGKEVKQLIDSGNKKEAAILEENFKADYNSRAAAFNDALKTKVLDWVIEDIKDLRVNLIKALKLAKERAKKAFQ